ncbi:hypothetical protein [Vibrio phage vB_VneS_J26]
MKNKPNSLLIPSNIYGERVKTLRSLPDPSSPVLDLGHRSTIIKNIQGAHADHLIKKFVAQYQKEGCTVDEVEPTPEGDGFVIEMSSKTRDIVILRRPDKMKLSVYVFYTARA